MASLEVPAATLYYETVGHGPVLLCIAGALGSVEPFRGLADLLKDQFTVVLYDRRGYSRSHLSATEAQDYEHRIETDADDAAALIKHVAGAQPASVLASSSGAVVGLELLIRHPDVVKLLVAHEPPAHTLLPDAEEQAMGRKMLYQLYRAQGVASAVATFAQAVKIEAAEVPFLMQAFDPRSGPYVFSNAQYWFERELEYPATPFDTETLAQLKDKLVLAVGEDSNPEAGHYRPNVVLSEKLSLSLTKFVGAHLGYASHAQQFAEKLLQAVKMSN